MKKILEKLFAILLISIISVSLTGCGQKNNDDAIDEKENNKQNSEEKNNKNETDEEEVSLYSDDTKIVFNAGGVYYLVYYHDGENITGLDYVYSYPDVDTAKFTETMLKASYDGNNSVNSVERKGKQIKISFNETGYQGLTVEEVKANYSMYEEIHKK